LGQGQIVGQGQMWGQGRGQSECVCGCIWLSQMPLLTAPTAFQAD